MPTHTMEILSPAGSLDTLICAVNNGADAVYIGGINFSARKNAVNFTNDDIISAVRYAHLYGSKVYVTVNTLVSDSQLDEVYEFVKFLFETGVDALIIQDLGILNMVRRCFPDFEIHASTQMTIHNIEGARIAKKLGFKRVVLSRELTFAEILAISQAVDIELEVFVHGALCMSYSGQCLMSSFLGSRSGNRGACAQPCRLPYTLLDAQGGKISEKDKYLLSLKDLCLVDEMDMLRKCNVKSLKIEGRMKSADYVSLVTHIYDKYRDGGSVDKLDMEALANIFSRSGFTKGYLEGKCGRHMLNYSKNNDKVYDNISSVVLQRAEQLKKETKPKIRFDAEAYVALGEPMRLSVSAKGRTVSASGTVVAEQALSVALNEERISTQIGKTGSTPYELGSLNIRLEEGVSLPVKEINEVRRRALDMLTDCICIPDRECKSEPFSVHSKSRGILEPKLNAEVRTLLQAQAAYEAGFDRLLIPYYLYSDNKSYFDKTDWDICVVLPAVLRDNRPIDMNVLPYEVYASNVSQLMLIGGRKVNADFSLNVYNTSALEFMADMGVDTVCISPELNLREISNLGSNCAKELIVYGRVRLMTVQNCVVKSSRNRCSCTGDVYYLKDRKGARFPLFTDKGSCTNSIYNSTPIYMADRMDELKLDGVTNLRFIFTTESPEEICDIYSCYRNNIKADFDFTRGHYYRGV
ncbi:MAG: U32 family peptidase [Clostridia bacterium]|nr:U32 family peptidase [Clostridia bacterium]